MRANSCLAGDFSKVEYCDLTDDVLYNRAVFLCDLETYIITHHFFKNSLSLIIAAKSYLPAIIITSPVSMHIFSTERITLEDVVPSTQTKNAVDNNLILFLFQQFCLFIFTYSDKKQVKPSIAENLFLAQLDKITTVIIII